MWSSKKLCGLAFPSILTVVSLCSLPAEALQQPAGFAVERFYQSAPGGGWFIMDDLEISGRLGGVVSFSSGYARNPQVITGPDGKQKLAVVSEEAFLDIGAAVTHDRFRGYINFPMPLRLSGTGGTLGPYQFTAPSVSFGNNPDTIADPRIGARQLNEALVPDSPNGSEFLYGMSGGRRFAGSNGWAVVTGPEIFGQTAFRSFFSGETGTEALLTGRFEHTGTGRNLRIKLGVGHALEQNFGAAQWRVVFGVELFGHT